MNLKKTGMTLVLGTLCAGAQMASAELVTGLTPNNTLITFDSATPGASSAPLAVTGLGAGESLIGIDRRPATGQLYGLSSASRLFVIDTVTGAATQVGANGAFALNGTAFGFDFNPTVDRIRVTSNASQNLRLNPNDGTLTATDTVLSYAAVDPNSGATPGVVGSAYTNNFAGATTTTLYDIDANLDILATQVPPNNGTLNTVGVLGFNTSNQTGFDISGSSGTAFASLTAIGAAASSLFTVNLTTGAATLIGSIGAAGPLVDIAVTAAIPEPSVTVLTTLGLAVLAFVMRRRRTSARV